MGTRLLIAEDNALFRRILLQSLSTDFDVTVTEDGVTAWEILKRNRSPIIAILDWVMPGMTGPEVCRQVRCGKRSTRAPNYLNPLDRKKWLGPILLLVWRPGRMITLPSHSGWNNSALGSL